MTSEHEVSVTVITSRRSATVVMACCRWTILQCIFRL